MKKLHVLLAAAAVFVFAASVSLRTDHESLPAGAAFVIDILQPGPTVFTTAAGALSHWLLDSRPDAVVLVGQVAASYGRQHPVGGILGASYNAKKGIWTLLDATGAAPKPSSLAAVEALRPGTEAYVHIAAKATIKGGASRLDHPQLDGNPDALFQISPIWRTGSKQYAGPLDIRYDGKYWNVAHADKTAIQAGSAFAVAI